MKKTDRISYTYKTFVKGDIGFSYQPKIITEMKLTLLLTLPFVLLGFSLIVADHFESRWRVSLLVIPIVAFYFVYKEVNVVAVNRKRERDGALGYFSNAKISDLCKATFGEDVSCLCSKYIIRHTEKLGVFERLVAAGLSNGKVVKFRVVQRTNEKGMWSLTIRTTPEIIDDELTAFKVLPLYAWLGRYFHPDNNVFVVLLIYLLIWVVLLCAIVGPMLWNPVVFAIVLWTYTVLGRLLVWTVGADRLPRLIKTLLSFPGYLCNLFFKFTAPILVFLMGAAIIIIVGVVFAILLYAASWFITSGSIGFNIDYAVFLLAVSLSLSSVYANKLVFVIFEHMDILWNMVDKSMESPMLGLIEYVYRKENINCLIYMAYLVFITVSTGRYFLSAESPYLFSEGVDPAITKAFLVHIAFTNMVTRWKEIKLKAGEAMEYVIKIMQMK